MIFDKTLLKTVAVGYQYIFYAKLFLGDRMGRVRTLMIKKMAKNLLEKYEDKFTNDFSKNKEALKQILRIRSKKLRNILAGYITSLVAKSKESS